MKKIIEHITYECPYCHQLYETRQEAAKCLHYSWEDFKIISGQYSRGVVIPDVLRVRGPNDYDYEFKRNLDSVIVR